MSFDIDIVLNRGAAPIAARFATPPGLVALFAPSGAGKTTTLDMIAGLVRPTKGRIVVAGEVLFDSAAGINLPPQQRACGYVFQDARLFPHMTVRDNLLYGWRLAPAQNRWMSLEEACARYTLTVDEFLSWQVSIDQHGLPGLRTTRIQQYRH